MSALVWDRFTKRIFIKTDPQKLYWCWATQEGICSWFLKDAVFQRNGKLNAPHDFIKPGDRYLWRWHNWDGQEEGEILELKENKQVKFSFAGSCEVLVTFEPKDDLVLLSLSQSKIPLDEKSKLEIFYGCSNGWTFWLANLKAYLEHGILLNETDKDLRGFDNSAYEFVNM